MYLYVPGPTSRSTSVPTGSVGGSNTSQLSQRSEIISNSFYFKLHYYLLESNCAVGKEEGQCWKNRTLLIRMLEIRQGYRIFFSGKGEHFFLHTVLFLFSDV